MLEYAKTAFCCNVGYFDKRKVEKQIGVIRTIAVHSKDITQSRERTFFDAFTSCFSDEVDHQSLNQRHHVVFRHKGHFQVQLGKFRLAVRALIFVAETACYLEVAIHTSHHQQLLQLLRRLWRRIELACIDSAWGEILTS